MVLFWNRSWHPQSGDCYLEELEETRTENRTKGHG